MNTETTLAIQEPRGIQLQTLDDMATFAEKVVKSGLAPKGFTTPESVLIAIQMGAEVGLPPMASLQNIAVINGRPCIWGDALLGIVRASGELEEFEERIERGDGSDQQVAAYCKVKRKGYSAQEEKFSVADAKKAGLWEKAGPWTTHPKRMLKYKSRNFVLRDQFADILKGFKIAEDVEDYQPIVKQAKVRETTQLVLPDEPEPLALNNATEEAAQ